MDQNIAVAIGAIGGTFSIAIGAIDFIRRVQKNRTVKKEVRKAVEEPIKNGALMRQAQAVESEEQGRRMFIHITRNMANLEMDHEEFKDEMRRELRELRRVIQSTKPASTGS